MSGVSCLIETTDKRSTCHARRCQMSDGGRRGAGGGSRIAACSSVVYRPLLVVPFAFGVEFMCVVVAAKVENSLDAG
jgi:hypothetical protein